MRKDWGKEKREMREVKRGKTSEGGKESEDITVTLAELYTVRAQNLVSLGPIRA